MTPRPLRAAIYARVSTTEQTAENQLIELRRYVDGPRAGPAVEYVDHGVSGAKDRRPALDRLVTDARRRRFDVAGDLAARSPGSQPEAPDHVARGPAGARRGVRVARRGHRRHDARREAPDAHPRGDRGVRAGKDRRAGAGRSRAGVWRKASRSAGHARPSARTTSRGRRR